eukprot:CAMPEP_0116130794 /NCGR_PEP_ID=MMETSP0329-20121206/8666_1 /TAXON_ID=697910 /ORGANISM="Pseudo-nitzschia arenysensis, Strain B593" /LENGTH=645 /DNA_ID=CAMNT_0003625189 /DNA_START=31 /DNA_END=1967 /DNA_ORIENTATION=-
MVWESPRRPLGEVDVLDESLSSSTPADPGNGEKLKAPIGLAVAVQHISTHRIRAQQQEIPFPQDHYWKQRRQEEDEEKQEDSNDDDEIVQTTCEKVDIASPSVSLSSPSKPDKSSSEIETQVQSESNDVPQIPKAGDGVVEANAQRTSIVPLAIPNDSEAIDSYSETEKEERNAENEQEEERKFPHLSIDEIQKKTGFIEECTDWLKLMITPSQEEEERKSKEEDISGRVDTKGSSNHTSTGEKEQSDVVDATTKLTSFSDKEELAQASIESESIEQKHSTLVVAEKEKQEKEISESAFHKRIERDIDSIFRNKREPMQVDTETSHGENQESSTNSEEDEEEEQQIIQPETESIESTAIESERESKSDTRRDFSNDPEYEKDDQTKIENEIEKQLAKTLETAEEEEKLDNTTGSDSDVEDNTNIFSGIPNSASFSEDEDDQGPVNEENALADTEDTPISGVSGHETSLLLYPENWADDITVAMSNVSPECRENVSKRKKKMKQYIHEYDKAQASSFEVETAALQKILVELPDDDHRSILSQLMIMTNARDRVSRTNLAFQVQDSLVALIEKHEIDVEPAKAIQIIFHLSRLKKSYRIIFGKSLFKAMSKLYKRSEKLKERKSTDKKKGGNAVANSKNHAHDNERI